MISISRRDENLWFHFVMDFIIKIFQRRVDEIFIFFSWYFAYHKSKYYRVFLIITIALFRVEKYRGFFLSRSLDILQVCLIRDSCSLARMKDDICVGKGISTYENMIDAIISKDWVIIFALGERGCKF